MNMKRWLKWEWNEVTGRNYKWKGCLHSGHESYIRNRKGKLLSRFLFFSPPSPVLITAACHFHTFNAGFLSHFCWLCGFLTKISAGHKSMRVRSVSLLFFLLLFYITSWYLKNVKTADLYTAKEKEKKSFKEKKTAFVPVLSIWAQLKFFHYGFMGLKVILYYTRKIGFALWNIRMNYWVGVSLHK